MPAIYIAVDNNPRVAVGQWSLANRWDSLGSQDNALAALALPNVQAGAALQANRQLLAMISRADIPLPDPVAYRRDWRDWRVRLTFGTPPGELETLVIAAPEPPPLNIKAAPTRVGAAMTIRIKRGLTEPLAASSRPRRPRH